MNMTNVIGEPSTVMFRRDQLAREAGSLFRWGGRTYHCLADLSVWLRLLSQGAAYYCAAGLAEFRRHSGQEQEGAGRLDCLLERQWIARQARASGFLADPAQWLAALRAVRAFASATDFSRVDAGVAERIREHLREVEAEIARASPGEPRPPPYNRGLVIPRSAMRTFQRLILTLQDYWGRQGCAILQPYDMEVGAGTSHTATFLRSLGPEPWRAAYVQPSRRPKDGRYGENPNRLQHYYQFQVVLKPRRRTSSTSTWDRWRRSASTSRRTTCASSRTTGRTRRWARGAWAGKSG
jgi:hypothetical protein